MTAYKAGLDFRLTHNLHHEHPWLHSEVTIYTEVQHSGNEETLLGGGYRKNSLGDLKRCWAALRHKMRIRTLYIRYDKQHESSICPRSGHSKCTFIRACPAIPWQFSGLWVLVGFPSGLMNGLLTPSIW